MGSLLLVTHDGAETARAVERLWSGRAPLLRVDSCRMTAVLETERLEDVEAVVVACGQDTDTAHRVCRAVRETTAAPMCLVAATRHEADELLALTTGCDDYMSTQSAPEVIRARLAMLAGRAHRSPEAEVATFGCVEVDPQLRTAEVHGERLTLTRIEFDLLHTLITHQRRVVPRWELLASGWDGPPPDGHVLDVHMSRLRCKVLRAGGPKVGEPVPGVGYRVGSSECDPRSCDDAADGLTSSAARGA